MEKTTLNKKMHMKSPVMNGKPIDDNKRREMEEKKKVMSRIIQARTKLLTTAPFFGNLLMHLKISLANCETACTDMKRIIFDPKFVNQLSDEELEFLLRHEVMHCVLQHCRRGKGLNDLIYNIASDIVVNSNIMLSMGVSDFNVAGEPAMHLTPFGNEGYNYSAEEVYEMLIRNNKSQLMVDPGNGIPGGGGSGNSSESMGDETDSDESQDEGKANGQKGKKKRKSKNDKSIDGEDGEADNSGQDSGKNKNSSKNRMGTVDNHKIWETLEDDQFVADEWTENVIKAAKGCGDGDCPPGVRKLVEDYEYEIKLNWKNLLNDFIHVTSDTYDYTFNPVDKRYSSSEFVIPAYNEIDSETVDNIWFVVDTSGSMDDETISHIFSEIKAAIEQFEKLKGKISFFDNNISEPIEFEDVETLNKINPLGGGGTNFHLIFHYMKEKMIENLPTAIIILTDGIASFPSEEASLGIPTLWIITENIDAPWGMTVHI